MEVSFIIFIINLFRFKVSLEATQPDVDDTIMLRSPMNKT